jgi:hypothetical protein
MHGGGINTKGNLNGDWMMLYDMGNYSIVFYNERPDQM